MLKRGETWYKRTPQHMHTTAHRPTRRCGANFAARVGGGSASPIVVRPCAARARARGAGPLSLFLLGPASACDPRAPAWEARAAAVRACVHSRIHMLARRNAFCLRPIFGTCVASLRRGHACVCVCNAACLAVFPKIRQMKARAHRSRSCATRYHCSSVLSSSVLCATSSHRRFLKSRWPP